MESANESLATPVKLFKRKSSNNDPADGSQQQAADTCTSDDHGSENVAEAPQSSAARQMLIVSPLNADSEPGDGDGVNEVSSTEQEKNYEFPKQLEELCDEKSSSLYDAEMRSDGNAVNTFDESQGQEYVNTSNPTFSTSQPNLKLTFEGSELMDGIETLDPVIKVEPQDESMDDIASTSKGLRRSKNQNLRKLSLGPWPTKMKRAKQSRLRIKLMKMRMGTKGSDDVPEKALREMKEEEKENILWANVPPLPIVRSTNELALDEYLRLNSDKIGGLFVPPCQLYLWKLLAGVIKPHKWVKQRNETSIKKADDLSITNQNRGPLPKYRMKVYMFNENYRPIFHFSGGKKSTIITGRRPFAKDKNFVDYDLDSIPEIPNRKLNKSSVVKRKAKGKPSNDISCSSDESSNYRKCKLWALVRKGKEGLKIIESQNSNKSEKNESNKDIKIEAADGNEENWE